ncbi:hypothetical protein GCM10023331_13660 [Algivirga pacifica]|uniref:Outer membrane protein beta-barrel domain-containing protein n=2 Tax=Algivirga pacifica TaxID=1162670 RepID=A0ABP9D4T8_9BACT
MLFLSANSIAQIDQHTLRFSVSGSYTEENSNDGFLKNKTYTSSENAQLGVSADYYFLKGFFAGVGLYYINESSRSTHKLLVNDYYIESLTDVGTIGYVPTLRLGTSKHLGHRFYGHLLLNAQYYSIENTTYTAVMEGKTLLPDYMNIANLEQAPHFIEQTPTISSSAMGAMFEPAVSYYFTKSLSCTIGLGGVAYTKTKGSEEGIFHLNFNPSHWSLGIDWTL